LKRLVEIEGLSSEHFTAIKKKVDELVAPVEDSSFGMDIKEVDAVTIAQDAGNQKEYRIDEEKAVVEDITKIIDVEEYVKARAAVGNNHVTERLSEEKKSNVGYGELYEGNPISLMSSSFWTFTIWPLMICSLCLCLVYVKGRLISVPRSLAEVEVDNIREVREASGHHKYP